MAVGQELVVHPFSPVVDGHSRVLILGSLPSVKSRENHFYYGHPQNRFWKVLAGVCQAEVPVSVEEKKAFLLANGIAVWDVIASCRIVGSSDSSIRDVAVQFCPPAKSDQTTSFSQLSPLLPRLSREICSAVFPSRRICSGHCVLS